MKGKKIVSLAAASVMGLSLAAAEARADGWGSAGWTGFGVGLLAAPLIYGITRPLFGGVYDTVYAPFGGVTYYGHSHGYGYGMHPASNEYCARRYRTYDPATNTFLGRDGHRYVCRS